jgi:hypothetical protein
MTILEATPPIYMSSLYRNGAFVSNINSNVPISGLIRFDNFRAGQTYPLLFFLI